MFEPISESNRHLLKSRVNALVGSLFIFSFGFAMVVLVLHLGWGVNPIVQAVEAREELLK